LGGGWRGERNRKAVREKTGGSFGLLGGGSTKEAKKKKL